MQKRTRGRRSNFRRRAPSAAAAFQKREPSAHRINFTVKENTKQVDIHVDIYLVAHISILICMRVRVCVFKLPSLISTRYRVRVFYVFFNVEEHHSVRSCCSVLLTNARERAIGLPLDYQLAGGIVGEAKHSHCRVLLKAEKSSALRRTAIEQKVKRTWCALAAIEQVR